MRQGHLLSADHSAQAARLFHAGTHVAAEGSALSNLASTRRVQGRLDEAFEHLRAALAISRSTQSGWDEAEVLGALAAVHRDAGQLQLAESTVDAALALAREYGAQVLIPHLVNTRVRSCTSWASMVRPLTGTAPGSNSPAAWMPGCRSWRR